MSLKVHVFLFCRGGCFEWSTGHTQPLVSQGLRKLASSSLIPSLVRVYHAWQNTGRWVFLLHGGQPAGAMLSRSCAHQQDRVLNPTGDVLQGIHVQGPHRLHEVVARCR